MSSNSYLKGMTDGLQLWGTVCGRQGNCEVCPIGSLRGANVSCQDFARQFPEKMLSILKEMNEGNISFYEEYCMRFPECNLSIEDIAVCACRKAIFEGYVGCENANGQDECVRCWNEKYEGDVTMVNATGESGKAEFCSNCGQKLSADARFCTECGMPV